MGTQVKSGSSTQGVSLSVHPLHPCPVLSPLSLPHAPSGLSLVHKLCQCRAKRSSAAWLRVRLSSSSPTHLLPHAHAMHTQKRLCRTRPCARLQAEQGALATGEVGRQRSHPCPRQEG